MYNKVNVKAGGNKIRINATSDLSNFYSELSKKWAVSDVIVEGKDYSSKYYARESKNSAVDALKSVETAKENAISELVRDASVYVNESKVHSENAGASAELAQITVDKGVENINAIIQSTPEKFAGFGLFDTKLTDHILEGQDAVGWALQGSLVTMTYPDAVAKVKELYENGTDTEYRGITCRRSHDGRYVADVAQKDAIDALFTESGVADFYILDVDNNQFYLPRSKWFNQMTLDTSLVNNFNEAGLPNPTGSIHAINASGNAGIFSSASGIFKLSELNIANMSSSAIASKSRATEVMVDFSAFSPIFGNSDTVQPPSSSKLLYYKVGNTVINESQIDVGNVLSDLPLKADKDLSNTAPSQAFKNMAVAWGMPDWESLIILSTSTSPFTVPLDGWLYLYCQASRGEAYVSWHSSLDSRQNSQADTVPTYYCSAYASGGLQQKTFYPVQKGEILKFIEGGGQAWESYYMPAKGAN